MFGTSEQAVKIYGLWFELKKKTISALCFIAEPQNLLVNLQLNSHLFWVQTPGPSPTKFCGQNCSCSFFPNFHWVGSTEIVQETIKNHQNKIIYIYINKFYPWFAEEIMPTCSMGQPSMLQA